MHEDSRRVGTNLTGRIKVCQQRAGNGVVDVGVVENGKRRLDAEFEQTGTEDLRA